ncbi:hypothetical protein [Sinorhizobium fredii]|uniref:hypothetical protein n=1 Tax=Rhizobium fredii TaxID=380 RepID=UPI00117C60EE|nr:hypothetical protein [Sinorhizobium fredii]
MPRQRDQAVIGVRQVLGYAAFRKMSKSIIRMAPIRAMGADFPAAQERRTWAFTDPGFGGLLLNATVLTCAGTPYKGSVRLFTA